MFVCVCVCVHVCVHVCMHVCVQVDLPGWVKGQHVLPNLCLCGWFNVT